MAFLNSALAFASSIPLKAPKGLWEWLLLTVFDFVKNYGWRIVLFTVCLKLLLCPLDIYQRVKARKNQKITERLRPQLEKLEKQYPDPNERMRKQQELQKKEGMSFASACLPAILTMVIFFTLLSGLNKVSYYTNFKNYIELYNVYETTYAETGSVESAQTAVQEHYDNGKTSFLWVKNIWSPDVPWENEIASYDNFKKNIGDFAKSKKYKDAGFTGTPEEWSQLVNKENYNKVMGNLKETHGGANGYLILPVLSLLMSLATQFISRYQQRQTGQVSKDMPGSGMMKVMTWVLPLMIGYFSLSYTTAFALYLVVQYSFSLLLTLITFFINRLIDKKEMKKNESDQGGGIMKYGRPDPNDLIKK